MKYQQLRGRGYQYTIESIQLTEFLDFGTRNLALVDPELLSTRLFYIYKAMRSHIPQSPPARGDSCGEDRNT